jgi:hypothetical protein
MGIGMVVFKLEWRWSQVDGIRQAGRVDNAQRREKNMVRGGEGQEQQEDEAGRRKREEGRGKN